MPTTPNGQCQPKLPTPQKSWSHSNSACQKSPKKQITPAPALAPNQPKIIYLATLPQNATISKKKTLRNTSPWPAKPVIQTVSIEKNSWLPRWGWKRLEKASFREVRPSFLIPLPMKKKKQRKSTKGSFNWWAPRPITTTVREKL